ncbi:MAG: FAD-dependent oxidoreductase [Flavobacteriaceae bacterium]
MKHIFLFMAILLAISCNPSNHHETDVLVIGGGTAGTAAAISSARMGVKTMLINETPWLGGMLTSAGVSAVDGNTKLLSGIWGEFRDSLVIRYQGANQLKTGWVSNHMFEPSIGAQIFWNMAHKENFLITKMETSWDSIIQSADGWRVFASNKHTQFEIKAKQVIDATELGDVAKAVGIPYSIGMDSRDTFKEDIAPRLSNDIIQDLTYVLILEATDSRVTPQKPQGYDPTVFYCATENDKCKVKMNRVLWPKEKMMTYGKLPNNKYMINWPINGNDYYANGLELSQKQRKVLYEKAKLKSKQFLYYLQTELGFDHLDLSKTEFPTKDGFPFFPYHRESRRIEGVTRITINDIAKPYEQVNPLYRTGIAVGDYPIDHHHDAHPNANALPELHFYPVPSYSIPLGCLIPKNKDNFIVTEKSISVTNIVNGTTRLQPVVLQLGQVAGITAALAIINKKLPRQLGVRSVQKQLLLQGGYLLPYLDVPKEDPFFTAYQRIGVTGILRGTGKNVGWENQTWFNIHQPLQTNDVFLEGWERYFSVDLPKILSVSNVLNWIRVSLPNKKQPEWEWKAKQVKEYFGFREFEEDAIITRGQFAVLIDRFFEPFGREVDLYGNFLTEN